MLQKPSIKLLSMVYCISFIISSEGDLFQVADIMKPDIAVR